MKKTRLFFSSTIVLSCFFLVIVACTPQSQPNAVTSTDTLTALPPNPIPTIASPTLTPTAILLPDPVTLLLTTDEIKDNFEYGPRRMIEGVKKGYHYYEINYFNSSIGTLKNAIVIAPEDWNEIPSDAFQLGSGLEFIETGATIDTPLVGDRAIVYTITRGRYDTGLVFTQGPTLVTIATVGIDLDTLLRYGQLIEQKLSKSTPEPLPIKLSEKVDESLMATYFTLLEVSSNLTDPKSTFLTSDLICLLVNTIDGAPHQPDPSFGVYDIENKVYTYKYTTFFGFGSFSEYCLIPDMTGQFEIRVEVDGALIKSIPFEIN